MVQPYSYNILFGYYYLIQYKIMLTLKLNSYYTTKKLKELNIELKIIKYSSNGNKVTVLAYKNDIRLSKYDGDYLIKDLI